MTDDNWRNRTGTMVCRGCIFYVPKQPKDGTTDKVGRCRRHAPTMKGFPVVFPSDWCGEHKLDEEKL